MVKHPWVIDVKVVVKGRVSYSEVYTELTRPLEDIRSRLLKAGRRSGFGKVLRKFSANFSGKPVGSGLCELIKARLQSMGGRIFSHESVKGWLREVGELLGYHVVAEYVSDYRFDVAWWSSEGDFKGEGTRQRSSRFSVVIVWPRPWLGLIHWISGTSTGYT